MSRSRTRFLVENRSLKTLTQIQQISKFEESRSLCLSLSPSDGESSGFTLVELILVMSLLTVVFALAAPSLSNFFRGRVLDAEARRFVSLARYGQSRAVSESTPMVLWIDLAAGRYGLRMGEDYTDANVFDEKEIEYGLGRDLKFDVPVQPRATAPASGSFLQSGLDRRGLMANTIRFLADGSIYEGSIESLYIVEGPESSIWITQSENRLKYEIRDKTNAWTTAYR